MLRGQEDRPQHHDGVVFETHIGIGLDVARGCQKQRRGQVLVTEARPDQADQLTWKPLPR